MEDFIENLNVKKIAIWSTVLIVAFILLYSSIFVVNPGERGIVVTLGKMPTSYSSEGVGFKLPFISDVIKLTIQQQTEEVRAQAFSSDLQTVGVTLKVLFSVPEKSIATLYQQYSGDIFTSLISPRVQEALKEVTATENAEGIAKKRETVKLRTLDLVRKKVGTIIHIEDIVIENVNLSDELEKSIEQKMVQEQEAAKAKFTKEKAIIDAETAVITAEGEAKAIKTRGEAIRQNSGVVNLMIAEKWNGVSPLVIGNGASNIMLPISKE